MDDIYLDLAKQKREALKARLQKAHPDSSPEQIDDMATNIMSQTTNSVTPEQQGLQEPEIDPTDLIALPKTAFGLGKTGLRLAAKAVGTAAEKEAAQLALKKMAQEGAEKGTGMFAKKAEQKGVQLAEKEGAEMLATKPKYGSVKWDKGPEPKQFVRSENLSDVAMDIEKQGGARVNLPRDVTLPRNNVAMNEIPDIVEKQGGSVARGTSKSMYSPDSDIRQQIASRAKERGIELTPEQLEEAVLKGRQELIAKRAK